MDLLSLAYFIEVAKDLHITRTAERLFISQQTLSNRIMKLEEYYGVKLLERKPSLSLTYAGELVLAFAKETVQKNQNLMDMLSDISREERGVIRFGCSRLRMDSSLPEILPKFEQEFPNVDIDLHIANSETCEQMILSGDYDIGLVTKADDVLIEKQLLISDRVYVCMRRSLLKQYCGEDCDRLIEQTKNGVDPLVFKDLPLCILDNHLGSRIMKHYQESGVEPHEFISCTYINLGLLISLKGAAACFATHSSLLQMRSENIPNDYLVFPIKTGRELISQQIYLIYLKDRYLNRYMRRYIELLKDYYHEVELSPVEKVLSTDED